MIRVDSKDKGSLTRYLLYQVLKLTLFIVLISNPTQTFSQKYIVNTAHYSEEDGLSNNTINSIIADNSGFIWLATEYGLNRFDGHHFEWFTTENDQIKSNDVLQLLKGEEDWVWILYGSANNLGYNITGIEILKTDSVQIKAVSSLFKNGLPFSLEEIKSATNNEYGHLLFVLHSGETYFYSRNTGFLLTEVNIEETAFNLWDNDHLSYTNGNQIITYNISEKTSSIIEIDKHFIHTLINDNKGNLYAIAHDELKFKNPKQNITIYKLNLSTNKATNQTTFVSNVYGYNSIYDPLNNGMVSLVQNSISFIDDSLNIDSKLNYTFEKTINTRGIHSLLIHNNKIFIISITGLYIVEYNSSKFTTYLTHKEEKRFSTRGITTDANNIYIGSSNGGRIIDSKTGIEKNSDPDFRELRNFPITHFEKDILITGNNSLLLMNKAGKFIKSIPFPSQYGQEYQAIFLIYG